MKINKKQSTYEEVSTNREIICNFDKQSFCIVAGIKPDWNVLGENWKMRCGLKKVKDSSLEEFAKEE